MASDEQVDFARQAVQSLLELQARSMDAPPTLPAQPEDLRENVRVVLTQAVRAELLTTGPHQVSRLLGNTEESRSGGRRDYAFSCGPISFDRGRAHPANSLVRSDGATLSFSVTLGQSQSSRLDLIAYRFDLAYQSGHFLRFDLDRPGERHSSEGLRAHIHACNEEVRLPSVVFHPLEALRFLLSVRPRSP